MKLSASEIALNKISSFFLQTPISLPRAVPDDMTEGAELEWLRAEHKDLSEKLETLRLRRAEDKTKLLDYERCKIQLQQLLEYKSKMTDAHADIQRQLQEARKVRGNFDTFENK